MTTDDKARKTATELAEHIHIYGTSAEEIAVMIGMYGDERAAAEKESASVIINAQHECLAEAVAAEREACAAHMEKMAEWHRQQATRRDLAFVKETHIDMAMAFEEAATAIRSRT